MKKDIILDFLKDKIGSFIRDVPETPKIVAVISSLFWVIALLFRIKSSYIEIATVDLLLGSIIFSILSIIILVLNSRIASYILLFLILLQSLIMGMSSSLLLVGLIFLALGVLLAIHLFGKTILEFLESLKRGDSLSKFTTRLDKRERIILVIIMFLSILMFARSYNQPNLGVNQQCYFATAHQSSYEDGVYDKFANVWEIKPVFHRAFIYSIYSIASKFSQFYNKESFETNVNSIYGLWTLIIISIGIVLGRKEFENLAKISWPYILLLAIAIQGVMVGKIFEVEEMVFSLSILSIGLILSRNRVLIFLAPFIFLYISMLKILTVFIPISIALFLILIYRFKRSEIISFLSGAVISILVLTLFFIKFSIFFNEISGARALQQGTVFFFGGIRFLTFIGALSKAVYYNPFILTALLMLVILLPRLLQKENIRFFVALLFLWLISGIIPLVMGKPFSYYALVFTISSFLTILLFIRFAVGYIKQITRREVFYIAGFSIFLLVYMGITPIVVAISLIILSAILLDYLSKNNRVNREIIYIVSYLFVIGFWLVTQNPLSNRDPSISSLPNNIKSAIEADSNYLNEEILYLCFGTKAYELGMKNSNRYFYSLAMLRHHQLNKVANATKGEMRYISRYGREMSENISKSKPLIETLNGALEFRGKYILFDKKGWCQRDLYPKLDSLISANYTILEDSKYETLFLKNIRQ